MINLIRPHQYIKNLFVFAPLFFSFHFMLNDYMDIEEDKKHPKKKFRPLASGEVSKNSAKILFLSLSTISLISAYILNTNLFIVLTIYFILNIAYSLKLKYIIIDIFIIATKLEIKNDKITGSLLTKNCYGIEKVNRIKEIYNLKDFEYIYAYGDSSGDKEMLSIANESFYKPFK